MSYKKKYFQVALIILVGIINFFVFKQDGLLNLVLQMLSYLVLVYLSLKELRLL